MENALQPFFFQARFVVTFVAACQMRCCVCAAACIFYYFPHCFPRCLTEIVIVCHWRWMFSTRAFTAAAILFTFCCCCCCCLSVSVSVFVCFCVFFYLHATVGCRRLFCVCGSFVLLNQQWLKQQSAHKNNNANRKCWSWTAWKKLQSTHVFCVAKATN